MASRSFDTPESDPELEAPQGPADWSRESSSDDRLSEEALARLGTVAQANELEPPEP